MSDNNNVGPLLAFMPRRILFGAIPVVLALLGACSERVEAPVEIDTIEAAFKTYEPHDTDFITPLPELVDGNGTGGAFDPAMCASGPHTAFIFARDAQGFVQGHHSGTTNQAWARYGNGVGVPSSKTFLGRLSCAMVSEGHAILVGREKDNDDRDGSRLYWSAATAADAQSNPYSESINSFAAIHATHTYTNAPAIAAHDGHLLVTVIKSGRLYAYYKDGNGNWSSRISGPVSPDGEWPLQGTPAVAYHGDAAQYHIYVRAKKSDSDIRLYRIYFDYDHFTGPFSLTSPTIQRVTLSPSAPLMESDPAVEWTGDPYGEGLGHVMTLYYRSGDKFYQSSSPVYPGDNLFERITDSIHNPAFTGALAVQGGVIFETGQHWFAGQDTSNRVYFGTSREDNYLFLTGPDCQEGVLPAELFGESVYGPKVVGCAGKVTWSQRATLCGPGSRPCTAAEWVDARGSQVPTHDYWTNDNLRYGGTSSSCYASTTSGAACPTGQPMRVCTSNGTDQEGNACNWTSCGYGSASPNQYFGGCANNTTAGTLCCLSQ